MFSAWEILFYLSTMGYVTIQGASQVLKAPSNAALCMRLGTVPSSDRPSHNSIAPSVDISVKKSSRPPSVQVAEKCALKDETPNRSANQTDQRPLKFRIKMSSDNLAQKNAIYIGLGLDDSPSSSSGNSSEESGGRPPVPRETVDESLSNIIKVIFALFCHHIMILAMDGMDQNNPTVFLVYLMSWNRL